MIAMKELKLTCSYTEWKKNKRNQRLDTFVEDTARLMELHMKNIVDNKLSDEEKEEISKLEESSQKDLDNKTYTNLCHAITDKCLNPIDSAIDYEEIGRLQYKIERLKYPCVLPEDEM